MSQILLKRNLLNILKLSKHSIILTSSNSLSNNVKNINNSILNKYQYTSKNKRLLELDFGFKNDKFLKIYSLNSWTVHKSSFHSTRILKEKNDDETKDTEKPVENESQNPQNVLPIPSLVALAPLQVPEFLPKVPLIAVARNPLFPNFIKMVEISDKNLMDLIRRKVHLNQPYIGLFMRKEDK